jgi:hypothetical protein
LGIPYTNENKNEEVIFTDLSPTKRKKLISAFVSATNVIKLDTQLINNKQTSALEISPVE